MLKMHTRPWRIIAAGLLVIALFFGGIGTLAATMPLSGAVIAPGIVKVSEERKTVQHLEGGIVDEILIREGSRVKKGDILIRLKSSMVNATADLIQGRLLAKQAEAARLRAQAVMKDRIQWPSRLLEQRDRPDIALILEKELDVFTTQQETLASTIAMQKTRIKQLNEKIAGAQEEYNAEEAIIASLEEELQAKKPLFEDGYLDKSQILGLQRMVAEHRGNKAAQRQIMAEAKEKIEEIKLSIVSTRNTYQEKAVTELSRVSDEIFELQERLKPQEDARERLDIRAPVAGTIVNLQIHSEEGGVIRPGQPILDIVPENAMLIIEGRLRQDKITQVHEGQPTRVQLSAFNRITTPPVQGELVYISADQITEETGQGPTSFYLVHVRVDPQELEKHNAYLSPGMPAVCFITTEKRTFLEYLVEPIVLNMDRSLRETL
jgi:HlyD family type I secretion membrane fusion protein